MPDYELALVGGELVDPATGPSRRSDVAFADGLVAAIEPRIDPARAKYVIDVAGHLVTPGLVDIHAHVFDGVGDSTSADQACLGRGTTTVVDGGSAGANTFEAFRRIVSTERTRVLAWLNLSTIGQVDTQVGELLALLHADVDAAVAMAQAHPDQIVGFKARLSTYAVGMSCAPALRLLRAAADAAQRRVMVHIGDTGEPLADILNYLRPGDVVSHVLTGRRNGILRPNGEIAPEVIEAHRRGVVFDSARGRGHVSFHVLRAALDKGLLPDTLSTDLTRWTAKDPDFQMPMMGNQLLAFGVPLEEVISRMTWLPAKTIGREDLGRLTFGGIGDATVLRLDEGNFSIRDVDGNIQSLTQRLAPAGAVRSGMYQPCVTAS